MVKATLGVELFKNGLSMQRLIEVPLSSRNDID